MPKIPKPDTPTELSFSDVEDGDIVVTYSELDAFRQCPLKHWLGYKQGYRKEPAAGSALRLGTLWHSVMEAHYTRLRDLSREQRLDPAVVENVRRCVTSEVLDGVEISEDYDKIAWMYDGHVEMYGGNPDWDILMIEEPGQVRMLDSDGQPTRFHYRFKIDLLVRNNQTGKLHLIDFKTTRTLANQAEVDIDDQFGLYLTALGLLGVDVFSAYKMEARKEQLKGDIDGSKPTPLDRRFRTTSTHRTEIEKVNIWADALAVAQIAYGPAYPDAEMPPSSPSPQLCAWRCDFLDAHVRMRAGTPLERAMVDGQFTKSDTKHAEYGDQPQPRK